ncbi:hypothetical protein [Chryseobacterium mucoviscidosis]|uniref:hypothetical protein n=1 Tax=Chryseobacterium mucoviscidosis TaxID=1945581 RepID=UPI00301B1453
MQLYPYHSPVRFYPSKEALSDMTNPQNCQYFGHANIPYPLEMNDYHRFLIPNYENEVDSTELELWLIGKDEVQIACEFGFNSDQTRLLRISFIHNDFISGHFEIKKASGETLFYSNCVQFVDSVDSSGRKYVRVATKCYFNRLGYDYQNSQYDWFVTNLPAHDLGLYTVESEYNTVRVGDMNSLEIQDSYIDEVSSFEFAAKGDCNILNFILSTIVNNEFYLNGTKRTIKEKPETDDYMILGKMKFVFAKESSGKYISIDENTIFSDAFKTVLGNPLKTIIYTYENNNAISLK